jgi:hypothetical protein
MNRIDADEFLTIKEFERGRGNNEFREAEKLNKWRSG